MKKKKSKKKYTEPYVVISLRCEQETIDALKRVAKKSKVSLDTLIGIIMRLDLLKKGL